MWPGSLGRNFLPWGVCSLSYLCNNSFSKHSLHKLISLSEQLIHQANISCQHAHSPSSQTLQKKICSSATIKTHMLSIRLLGKSTLHLLNGWSPVKTKVGLHQNHPPIFNNNTVKHHIKCISILNYFYNNIDISFLKVVVKSSVGQFRVRIFLNSLCISVIFNGTQCFLSLVSRGRACISISSLRVWLKALLPVAGWSQPLCHIFLWQLSGHLVTDWTNHNTDTQNGIHTRPSYLISFQFQERSF